MEIITGMIKKVLLNNALCEYRIILNVLIVCLFQGAQWPSGRVLDSRPKDSGFEPHRRHCVVVLEQDTFILA